MDQNAREIDAVVFDVGWVLVRLEYEPLLDCLARAGFERRAMPEVVAAIGLESHERGELAGEELIDALLRLAPGPIVRAEIEQHWVSMFRPVEEMFDLARSLAQTRRVHLLSNVGELHWRVLCSEFGLDRLGHGALPSFEARAMKPDDRIYAEAERRFGLVPGRTVFIDDLAPNVAAARRRGWHAIQHVDPGATIAALAEMGVRQA
ncbi:MAG TPA: HAD-IA family hydrolase [Steroidobacteraceae bacterium]|nr:HAD-IA family hydrolase [Steroidobacteraceae bacterium]